MGITLSRNDLKNRNPFGRINDRIQELRTDSNIIALMREAEAYDHYIHIDDYGYFKHLCETDGFKINISFQMIISSSKELQETKDFIINHINEHIAETKRIRRTNNRNYRIDTKKLPSLVISDYI